jgi:hypothetical protein
MYSVGSKGVMEEGYCNGSYEAMVEKSVDAEEESSGLETNETSTVDGLECDKAVLSLSSAGEGTSGSVESQLVLSETEDPGDGQMVCGDYACSSCGITFNSVMEHIRMYHGGEEVVIEVCVWV